MSSGKDVIYIDIEDDITAIIGQVKSSSKKIVALVPPKRASVFNSFVNLKLLKKAATDANKRLVLVTADDSLTNLAGNLGIYVAKNLQTPPVIPEVEARPKIPSAVIQASGVEIAEEPEESLPGEQATEQAKTKKPKKLKPLASDKKLPDFNQFRKWLFIGGGGLAALLLLWWWAFFVAPTAKVVLSADQTRIRSEFDLIVGLTDQEEAPDDKPFISGQRKSIDLTQTAEAKATGEENQGDKATGSITIENCDTDDPVTFVKNTRVRSSGGVVFLTDQDVTVPGASFSGGSCSEPGTASVDVTASEPGDDNNIAATSYEFVNASGIYSINGTAMGGGTDDIVSILTQDDVDRAVAGLTENDTTRSEILNQLREEFSGEVYLFEDTLENKPQSPKSTPKVGSETELAQVVVSQRYSILGVGRTEFESILTGRYESELKPQQAVTNTGIDELVPTIKDEDNSSVLFNIIANGLAGPDIDIARLKDELTARGYSDALKYVEELPSVTDVEIELSPIWVGSLPRSASKITIEIESPGLNEAPETDQTETE